MPTSETVCFRYFLDLLMANRRPVMLVGNAGSGKTVLINNKLSSLDGDETLVTTIPLNYYTNSLMLQQVSVYAMEDEICFISKQAEVLYSGKLSREKAHINFKPLAKVFSIKFGCALTHL